MDYSSKICKKYIINIKDTFIFIAVIFLFAILLFYQDFYSTGIKNGIYFCVNTLIPSLFPFMFFSSYIIKSGISNSIGKILSPITKTLFYLPGCAGTAIILGLIGGYPTSSKCIQQLLLKNLINEEQADRILKFSIGAGPAFIISVVGGCLLKNAYIGLIIFASQIFTSLFIGILLGFHARITKKILYEKPFAHSSNKSYIESMILSCNDAINSTINMCSLVILFASFLSIINSIKIMPFLSLISPEIKVTDALLNTIFSIFLEVNSGCISIKNLNSSPILMSFAIGWGGICVHFQIISILSGTHNVKIFKFTAFRLIQGIISALCTYFFINIIDLQIPTMSLVESQSIKTNLNSLPFSSSIQGGFALVLVCVYFLYNIGNTFLMQNPKNNRTYSQN